MHKILIVDDEQKIREVLREYALYENFEVCEAQNGLEAVEICKSNKFDAIVLDIMMPKMDGISACIEIKKYTDAPILMLSARDEEYDKLSGFALGIDDYVTKPFSPKEVMARLNVMIRRYNKDALTADSNIYEFGGLKVDVDGREVYVDSKKVEMTPKEYELLFYLIEHINKGLKRDQILTNVWGYDFYGDDRTVDTHIKMLRNSLGPYRGYIVTLRGHGYKFEVAQ